MKTYEITGVKRENIGKKDAKALRKEERVPCVLYGGKENLHFSTSAKELKNAIYTPNVYIMNLDIDGKKIVAVIQDIQFHPVSDEVTHIDFLEVKEGENVKVEVPVKLEGFAKGVQKGGKLHLAMRRLKVSGLVDNLPDELTVNVDDLDLGKSIKIGELDFENLEILHAKNAVVATVRLTRAARAAAVEAAKNA
ncbi:MAG: 50S ribosomal protein L25/general stress protein Ctc [Bacteroidales bacterium]|jgi:large subunit ribosomal protein L25|nr:50S ribosomal protein L25/general stress protein Ctc [Bacteroidales bacterium]